MANARVERQEVSALPGLLPPRRRQYARRGRPRIALDHRHAREDDDHGPRLLAVFFHRRRTGVLLNVRAGVRLGWITGVIMFAIITVIFTLTIVPVAANGGIATLFRQQLKNPTDPNIQEALHMLETAPGLAAILLVMLLMLFVFITLLSMAGGALGAKFVSRNQ